MENKFLVTPASKYGSRASPINDIVLPQVIKKKAQKATEGGTQTTTTRPFCESVLHVQKSKMFSDVISEYSDTEEERIHEYKRNMKSAKFQDEIIKDYVIS